MHIDFTNLPETIVGALNEDIGDLNKAAARLNIAIPELSLKVISLQQPEIPDNLPIKIKALNALRPTAYKAVCDWEIQCQSFQVLTAGNTVYCIGRGDSGAYYAFLETLHKLTGVIWAGVNEDDIIFAQPGKLSKNIHSPTLAFRARDGEGPTDMLSFLKWLGRNRYNMWRRNSNNWIDYSDNMRRQINENLKSRCIQLTLGDHAMNRWLPEKEFEKHPDWFGMRNGVRSRKAHVEMPECPHLNAELPVQPCYSNSELVDFITDNMATHVREYPELSMFGLWPHDGVNNWCQCDDCLKKTPYEHMYHLAMQLIPKIPEHIPIELIAYSNLLNIPFNALPANNRIFTMLCPYLRHYKHHIYDEGGPTLQTGNRYPAPDRINPADDREYGYLFTKWGNFCRTHDSALAIFEYGATFYDETRRTDRTRYFYHPSPNILHQELCWYISKGISLYYLCGYFRGWPDLYHEYSLARMLWNTGNTPEESAEYYYSALFGKHGKVLFAKLKQLAVNLLNEADITESIKEIRQCLKSCPPGSAVERYKLWLRYLEMGYLSRMYEKKYDFHNVVEIEDRIDNILSQNKKYISGYLTSGALRYGEINKERAIEKLEHRQGSSYKL